MENGGFVPFKILWKMEEIVLLKYNGKWKIFFIIFSKVLKNFFSMVSKNRK